MREYPARLGVSDRIELLNQALGSGSGSGKAGLLYELSAAFADAGQNEQSARAFQAACRLDSHAALTSLVGPLKSIRVGDAPSIRARAKRLLEYGVTSSPVMAALAIAEGLLGYEAGVKWLMNYDQFFVIKNTQADNAAELAAEIRSDLKFYDQPAGRSIRKGWRHPSLNRSALPAIKVLCDSLRDHVDGYIRSLGENEDHPFQASAPADYILEAWAVVSDGSTYHESHIHHRAWLSGVFYIVPPPASLEPDMHRGWLHVGAPKWLSPLPGWDEKLIEPKPGTLVLMPAYFFHHTLPMGVDGERMCVAFDVVPAALAPPEHGDY